MGIHLKNIPQYIKVILIGLLSGAAAYWLKLWIYKFTSNDIILMGTGIVVIVVIYLALSIFFNIDIYEKTHKEKRENGGREMKVRKWLGAASAVILLSACQQHVPAANKAADASETTEAASTDFVEGETGKISEKADSLTSVWTKFKDNLKTLVQIQAAVMGEQHVQLFLDVPSGADCLLGLYRNYVPCMIKASLKDIQMSESFILNVILPVTKQHP